MDDGLLDGFVFKGPGFKYALRHFLRILSRRCLRDPEIIHREVPHIEIATDSEMPTQLDGDTLTHTLVSIRVVPCVMRVLVPSAGPSILFVDPI